jgi:hypothetical protein
MTDERFLPDEPFESDLRTILYQMAPREVPEGVRAGVAEVPFRTTQSAGHRWLPEGHRLAGVVALLTIVVVALALIAIRSTPGPGSTLPTPHSSLISGFVEQTDGVAGYRMLRPSNWTALGGDPIDGRVYLGPGPANIQQGIVISVVNLKVAAASTGSGAGMAQWLLFQQNSSLAGWTSGIEAMWARDAETFTLVRTLPHAKTYLLSPAPGSALVFLVAYAIDQGQPFIVQLQAGGTEADLSRLEAQGVVDDFATMVGSITAIPADPLNVVPALPASGTPLPGPS